MNSNKFEEIQEKGQLVDSIKTPSYYYVLIMGIIVIISITVISIINETFNGNILIFVVLIIGLMTSSLKKIKIYEKCIEVNKKNIKYKDINSFEFTIHKVNTMRLTRTPSERILNRIFDRIFGRPKRSVNYLEINFGNSENYRLSLEHYSLKKLKLLTQYIEQYTNLDVQSNYEFLEEAELKDKKDIKISIIVMVIFIIIAFLVIKFHFIPLAQRYN